MLLKTKCVRLIEIIDIECGFLYRVSQKIVATKWRIYKGKISSPHDILCKSNRFFSRKSKMADLKGKLFCQIGPLSRDSAHSISNNSMVRPKGIKMSVFCISVCRSKQFEKALKTTDNHAAEAVNAPKNSHE